MMKEIKNRLYIFIFTLALFIGSCSQDEITKFPVSALSEDAFWSDEADVQQAVNALYFLLEGVNQIQWDGLTEIIFSQEGAVAEMSTGGINPGASFVNSLWTGGYAAIRDANWFLDNVGRSPLSDAELAKYQGQARFIRAWMHYKLLYQFGDVPLVDRVLSIEEGQINPSSRSEVLNFVLAELDQAMSELSAPDYEPEFGRITRWAVMAAKARILLYEGTLSGDNTQLQQSADLSKQIIDQGGFSLHPNYTELFRPEGDGSNEVILARVYANIEGEYHDQGQRLGPISFHAAFSWYTPTMALVQQYPDINGESIETSAIYDPNMPFENRDPRFNQSIFNWMEDVNYEGAEFINTGTWLHFRKFIDPSETEEFRSHGDYIIFRLGESYLNYVEAMNEISGPSQELLDLVNQLRTRAGQGAADDGSDITVPPISLAGLTQESFREIIRRERIIELAGEGVLYYDYHRWNLLDETMNSPAVGVVQLEERLFTAPRDYTWPIPEFELINNPNLTQNMGY